MTAANRVAINTSVQYLRLILNVVIGLYSVRIILNALGVDDYGIYDVIGGVIALLGFVSSSLSQTSIRYISVSLGQNSLTNVRNTFNDCFWLHLIIASFLVIVIEIVGLFLFDGALNIPLERLDAAQWVYHFMALTLFLNICITPFTALIIAHEKFVYTASIGILDSVLKLLIAFLLTVVSKDRLIMYGVLMTGVTIVNVGLYLIYLFVNYKQELYVSRPIIKRIRSVSGFAGWTIMDVIGVIATRQGYALILNKFFGTATNAAFAIARQIEGHIFTISASVIDTMKPQIMKSYGAGDNARMFRLSMTAGKLGFSMMSLVAIPLLVMMSEVLRLWLVNVPDSTNIFARLLIIATMVEQLTRGLVYSCQATGNIKWFSIITSTCRFAALPISIILLAFGMPAVMAFWVFVACEIIGSFSRIVVMSRLSELKIVEFVKQVIVKSFFPFALVLFISYAIHSLYNTLLGMSLNALLADLLFLFLMYHIGLDAAEKRNVIDIGQRVLQKFTKNGKHGV